MELYQPDQFARLVLTAETSFYGYPMAKQSILRLKRWHVSQIYKMTVFFRSSSLQDIFWYFLDIKSRQC